MKYSLKYKYYCTIEHHLQTISKLCARLYLGQDPRKGRQLLYRNFYLLSLIHQGETLEQTNNSSTRREGKASRRDDFHRSRDLLASKFRSKIPLFLYQFINIQACLYLLLQYFSLHKF